MDPVEGDAPGKGREDFLIEMCLVSGRPLQWGAVSQSEAAPGRYKEQLAFLERAHREGAWMYAQTASNPPSPVFELAEYNGFDAMPNWIDPFVGTPEERIAKLKQPGVRDRMRQDVGAWIGTGGQADTVSNWAKMRVVEVRHPRNYQYGGMTVAELAEATGKHPMALHHKTANNYLNYLSALFNWAVKEGHAEKNPAVGLQIAAPQRHGKSRLPFSTDQLNRIFHAPLYLASKGRIESRDGRFWVPLLSLWTGMRLNECVQLRTDDVAVRDGVEVILVRPDEEGGKRLKTDASERFVPIHSELKRIGFLAYVDKMKRLGATRVFLELPKGKRGYYSDPFQKWFSRFLASIATKTPKTSFHSFRHCFRDVLRDADMSTERVRALGGWTSKRGAEEIYGAGHRASNLAKEIEKVRYPGLDLSHLYL
jgi:integrase